MADSDHDDDITIPRAAMNKMIKEFCPHSRVANEARELILACSTEFIHLVSSEANEICNNQQKKTISAEHVLQGKILCQQSLNHSKQYFLFSALESLGYGDFKKEAEGALAECKAVAEKKRRQSTRLENLGMSEEELLRVQQELFAKAREEAAKLEQQEQQKVEAAASSTSATAATSTTSSSTTSEAESSAKDKTSDT